MDFMSSFYRNLKIGVAGIGSVMAVSLIIVGVIATKGTLGIVMAVGGSIWLASSGFIMFDSTRVSSLIKRDVDRLKRNTLEFKFENQRLNNNVTTLTNIQDRLVASVSKSENQVKTLSILKIGYEKTISAHKKILIDEKKNGDALRCSIIRLQRVKENLIKNVKMLNLNVVENKTLVKELREIKDVYIVENDKLQEANKNNTDIVTELQKQVFKLKELYKSTQILLHNLSTAGDMFSEFTSTIGESTTDLNETREGYDDTLKRMNKLLDKMKDSTFKDIDDDGDGIVTRSEFSNFTSDF
jgi:chromosome segregation ATPase